MHVWRGTSVSSAWPPGYFGRSVADRCAFPGTSAPVAPTPRPLTPALRESPGARSVRALGLPPPCPRTSRLPAQDLQDVACWNLNTGCNTPWPSE